MTKEAFDLEKEIAKFVTPGPRFEVNRQQMRDLVTRALEYSKINPDCQGTHYIPSEIDTALSSERQRAQGLVEALEKLSSKTIMKYSDRKLIDDALIIYRQGIPEQGKGFQDCYGSGRSPCERPKNCDIPWHYNKPESQ